jgi:hypothetical protein
MTHYPVPSTVLPLHSPPVQMNVACDNHVITFTSDKCFGPDDISQKRMEWNETGDRGKTYTSSSPQPIGLLIIWTYFCMLVIERHDPSCSFVTRP